MSTTHKVIWLALLGLLIALSMAEAEDATDGTLREYYAQYDTAHTYRMGDENVDITYKFVMNGGKAGTYTFNGPLGGFSVTTDGTTITTADSYVWKLTAFTGTFEEKWELRDPTNVLVSTVKRNWIRSPAVGETSVLNTLTRTISLRNPLVLPDELKAQTITNPTGGAWNNQKGVPHERIALPQYGPQGITSSAEMAQAVYDGVLGALRDSGGEYIPPYLEKVEIADGAYATENKAPLENVYADTVTGISTVKSVKPSVLAKISNGKEFDGLGQLGTVSSVVLGNITLVADRSPFNVSVDLSPWQNLIAFFRACLNLGLLVCFVAKCRQLPEKFL